jgi:hypothetical protein
MKKSAASFTVSCLILAFLAVLLPATVRAEGWTIKPEADAWERFTLGIVSGIAAHELGHMAVATSKGYKVSYDGLSIVYPGAQFTRASQLQVASAGFQTQWVLSEFALRDEHGREHSKRPGDFAAGIVGSYIGVSIAYLTILKDRETGDVYGMSTATGLSRDRIALMMAIPAVLDAWRLFGDDVPAWVPALSVMSKGVAAAWVWSY